MPRSPVSDAGKSHDALARDYVALSAGQLLAKIAGFVAFAYLARKLSPAAYGAVELANALVVFSMLVIEFSLDPIGAREMARSKHGIPSRAAVIPAFRLGLTVLACLAILGVAAFSDLPQGPRLLIVFYGLSLLPIPWILNWLFQGLQEMSWVVMGQVVRMGIFALLVMLWVSDDGDLWKVGVVELIAAVALSLCHLVAHRRYTVPLRWSTDAKALRSLAREALPLGSARLVWALAQYIPSFLVAAWAGAVEMAWFGAGHRVVIALRTFVILYHFNIYPHLVKTMDSGASAGPSAAMFMDMSFRLTAWVGMLGGLGGTLFADLVCRLTFGEPFRAAAPAFAWMVWVLPLTLWSMHGRSMLIVHSRPRGVLAGNLAGGAITLALALPCIERWGSGRSGGAFGALPSRHLGRHAGFRIARRRLSTFSETPAEAGHRRGIGGGGRVFVAHGCLRAQSRGRCRLVHSRSPHRRAGLDPRLTHLPALGEKGTDHAESCRKEIVSDRNRGQVDEAQPAAGRVGSPSETEIGHWRDMRRQ